jgi:hypothetical protein
MHDKFPDCEDCDATATNVGCKDPFDLPVWRNRLITVTLACMTLTVLLGSSIFSGTVAVTHDRGWSHRLASRPFPSLSMLVGILASCVFLAWYSSNYYQSRLQGRGKVYLKTVSRRSCSGVS